MANLPRDRPVETADRLLPWLAALVVMLAAGVALTLTSIRQLSEDSDWVTITYQVTDALADVRSRLREAEAIQRTYLLTGEGDAGQALEAPISQAIASVQDLAQLRQDQQPTADQLADCEERIRQLGKQLRETARVRRSEGLVAALEEVRRGESATILTGLLSSLSEIESAERSQLRGRLASRRSSYRRTMTIGLLSGLTAIAGLFAFIWLIRRHLAALRAREMEVAERLAAANLLAAIVESSHDAIISKSIDGVIETWNKAAERMFGYTAKEAIGQNVKLILPPDRYGEEDEILQRLRQGERIEHFETLRLTKDGRQIHVSLSISPIRSLDGRVVSASKIARDVTDKVEADAALRESEERFRMMADNMSQFAWIADEKGYIFWYNQRWYNYTGTTLEEMQGWGWRKVHHPDHIDRVVKRIQHSWDTGEEWEDLFPLRGKHGEYRWFLSRAVPIRDEQGQVVRWFGTNTDVTEQRQAEQALRLADERKNEFLAMLAHELRNPLTPIRGGVDLMAADQRVDPQSMEVVQSQLDQLVRLVDDLLDVSRIMRGKVELRTAPVELTRLVSRTAEGVRGTTDKRGQTLDVHLPDAPVWLNADAVRLGQVIGNLLNNASKYSDHGAKIELTLEQHDDTAAILVKDDGLGMEEDLLPNVFDLFTQATRAIDRSQGGLGIGLTIVKQLVELHGGRVSAHSDGLGAGSTFRVELPTIPAPNESPDNSDATNRPAPAAESVKVLVVDDNVGATWMLTKLLEKLNQHQVDTAHDGPTALAKALEQRPNLMILDIGLPGMDGYDVARAIRQQSPEPQPYLVALTGYGQETDRQAALDAGFDQHLVKPAGIKELETLLAGIAERESTA